MGEELLRVGKPVIPEFSKPNRLNPVCPVCGEDEPGMVWLVSKLVLRCRRCKYGEQGNSQQWHIDPLSKPWEDKVEGG